MGKFVIVRHKGLPRLCYFYSMSKLYTFPIGVDDQGRRFQWVEDSDIVDCSKCCFWYGRCRYHELNSGKGGECFGSGYFQRLSPQGDDE